MLGFCLIMVLTQMLKIMTVRRHYIMQHFMQHEKGSYVILRLLGFCLIMVLTRGLPTMRGISP